MHANPGDEPIFGDIRLEILVGTGALPAPRARHARVRPISWRGIGGKGRQRRLATRRHQFRCRSTGRAGTFHVLAPVLGSGLAVIGDVTKFVTAGDARIEVSETSTGVRLVVKGAGERITVTGWADVAPTSPDAIVTYDPSTGVWTLDIDVPSRGWAHVLVDA